MEVEFYPMIFLTLRLFNEFIIGLFLWALFLMFRGQWESSPEHISKGRHLINV